MRPGHPTWNKFFQDVGGGIVQWLDSPWVRYAPAAAIPILERLATAFDQLVTEWWPKEPQTLCHLDFHLQNLFFDGNSPDDPIVIFDWDGCHIGPGAHDISYLLSYLPVAYRREHEHDLLETYRESLERNGVAEYSYDDLVSDYRFGCLFNTWLLPTTLSLDLSGDEMPKLAEQVIGGFLSNILDHDAGALLDKLSV